MKKKDPRRNIYRLTPAGWQHMETGELVTDGGIPLDSETLQSLKELHLEREREDHDSKRQRKIT